MAAAADCHTCSQPVTADWHTYLHPATADLHTYSQPAEADAGLQILLPEKHLMALAVQSSAIQILIGCEETPYMRAFNFFSHRTCLFIGIIMAERNHKHTIPLPVDVSLRKNESMWSLRQRTFLLTC